MSQKVAQKIGKYEVIAELGQGGMGVVYKARDPIIGRMVAIKTITPELLSDPEVLKRFYREAQSAGTLQHPNIVTIHDLGEANGCPYIVMEYVEGESLREIINRRSDIPLAAKLRLAEQFCEGLSHAHKHGLVHRDVKPANILVTKAGHVKVVDFGIVHVDTTTLTKTGMFLGTVHYASPEQVNDIRVDSRSDLWSVACVIYELIAYKKPFDGSNISAVIAKILSSEPEPLSRCCPDSPPELDQIISKGLKKHPEERYQSLDELLGDLFPIARHLQMGFIGNLLGEAEGLRGKGDFSGAHAKVRAVLYLDNSHAEAIRLQSEINLELQRLPPELKSKYLVAEAELALGRGEYTSAIQSLDEAQKLSPLDSQAQTLRDKALGEQQHARELRESLSASQKAMKQGELTEAEQHLHRLLEIDRNNPQAAELLESIRQDRLQREREFHLKEALWNVDNLVSKEKYQEARDQLLKLQHDYPDADEISRKLQTLNQMLGGGKPTREEWDAASRSGRGQTVRLPTEALHSQPQSNEVGGSSGSTTSTPTRLVPGPSAEAAGPPDATSLIGASPLAQQPVTSPKAATGTGVEALAPGETAPALPELPKKEISARSWRTLAELIALGVLLALGALFVFRHKAPAGPTGEETRLEVEAQGLQEAGDLQAALFKWRELSSKNGTLKGEADRAIAEIAQKMLQEKDLYNQARAAEDHKNWDEAIALYKNVAGLNGPLKDQALEAIPIVMQLQRGMDISKIEEQTYAQADTALTSNQYALARGLFQLVINLKVPDSTLAPKAQAAVANIDQILKSMPAFNAAERAENTGDLRGALAQFQKLANTQGPLAAQAKARIPQLNDKINNAAAQQEFSSALQKERSGDLNGALTQFKVIAEKPGPYARDAQAQVQQINDQLIAAAARQQFDAADHAQATGDLKGALAQFKSLADRPGPLRAQAQARAAQLAGMIADANKPKPAPPNVRNPVATVILSGDPQPWTRPVQKGMILPDTSVDGGLNPTNLSVAAIPGAPPGSAVTIIINIDETGKVTPGRILKDTSGYGQQVSDAARSWKFRPPTVKDKPIRTSVSVKVTF
jgi:hypothetical protein